MKSKALKCLLMLLIIFLLGCQSTSQNENSASNMEKTNTWITISYGSIVDKSILTHSGESVGEVIKQIPDYDDSIKGLVQPYLEPYSILCHDVVYYFNEEPVNPLLINILAHYPIDSEQPAWVDLFREGHFQLYYNEHLIRLFLKGSTSETSFEKYKSIVRHL